uniref:Rho termination factor-like N-terminal domain-containing protein n=1 Tax=viral metagenome TaxID=1070528 RepID=A0A6C0CN31_9ZZZZ
MKDPKYVPHVTDTGLSCKDPEYTISEIKTGRYEGMKVCAKLNAVRMKTLRELEHLPKVPQNSPKYVPRPQNKSGCVVNYRLTHSQNQDIDVCLDFDPTKLLKTQYFNYSQLDVKTLRNIAKDLKIERWNKLKKNDLISKIMQNETEVLKQQRFKNAENAYMYLRKRTGLNSASDYGSVGSMAYEVPESRPYRY